MKESWSMRKLIDKKVDWVKKKKKLKISQNTLNGMNMNENECTWKIPSRGCHYCEKVQVLHNMTLEMS